MFKTQAIILHVQKIRDSKVRIIFFTREYGRISCWFKKREFSHGIWDIVLIYIERIGSENMLRTVEARQSIIMNTWKYCTIIPFLEIIRIFYALLPESVPHTNIFDDYLWLVLSLREWNIISLFHYILFQFRILKILGIIDGSKLTWNPRMNYIDSHITIVPIRRILESKPLNPWEWELLQKINLQALYRLT